MSKAVKAVTGAVSSVVKGAVGVVKKVVSGATGLLQKISSSKLGKAVVIAAAIYFGGAAIAGGMGSSAAGGSFLSGMGTGVSSAAGSLSSAWGSAMTGEFSAAGSTLGNAWGTAGAAGQTAGAAQAAANAGAMTGGGGLTTAPNATNAANTVTQTQTGNQALIDAGMKAPAPQMSVPGSVTNEVVKNAGAGSSIWNSPYTAPALITGGMQAGGSVIAASGQAKSAQEQRDYEARLAQEARDRYNANVGSTLWANDQGTNPQSGQPNAQPWDAVAEARAISARYATPAPAVAPSGAGVIARNMQPNNPAMAGAGGRFPTYNPYYNRNYSA